MEFPNGPTDPKNYLIAFLKKLLFQREKLKKIIFNEYLGEGTSERWNELLSLLEEENRRLLKVEAENISFTLFCPTKESFKQLNNTSWRKRVENKLEGLLANLGRHST